MHLCLRVFTCKLFGEFTMVLKVPFFIQLAPCVFRWLFSHHRRSLLHILVVDDADLSC